MKRIGIASFTLVLGLVAASSAQAQSNNVLVCNDGQVVSAASGTSACNPHGGVNTRETLRAQQSGRYDPRSSGGTRGVYDGGANRGTGTRGVYRGGSNGGVYPNGGVYGSGNPYPNRRSARQCADGTWSPAGASGCHGHGGVLRRDRDNRVDGRYDGDHRDHDEDDDRDEQDDDRRWHGRKHDKHEKHEKHGDHGDDDHDQDQ